MDSLEGSVNDAMTAEIDRRVNEAVNSDPYAAYEQRTDTIYSRYDYIGNERWYNDSSRGAEEAPTKPSEVYRKA
ncbi:pol-like protein [Colletotrichum kahawae]|uniref:Pol-like protein n=1 Tax=Colletotrichum kahawae TaxID=34407 RepID=A0AAE0D0Q6_COLKA|nr:pol-like protein [Colletotrichum kahawae]